MVLAGCSHSVSEELRLDPGAPRAAPRGYIAFCTANPGFCDGDGARQVTLTNARWAELLTVNDHYNGRVAPRADAPDMGMADDWRLPGPYGDCEDLVLGKKAKLIELGWPKPALRIAVVDIPAAPLRDRRHAVLLVDTSEGVFVLDSRTRKVQSWEAAPYRWVAVQASTDPDVWEGVVRTAASR